MPSSGGHHRRYMVHGTSHHLGIDVHDCAQARREMYYDGMLEPGMVFTIEPGLYFQIDDLTVPEEYRGIGVRIEDDILMTDGRPGEPLRRHPAHRRRGRGLDRRRRALSAVTYTAAPSFTTRPTLTGTFGMSASTHWLATATAQAVLERGGNAFDAAVAGALRAARRRAAPQRPGRRPGRRSSQAADAPAPTVLMGQGPAPAGATIDHYPRRGTRPGARRRRPRRGRTRRGRRLAAAAARPRHVGARRRARLRDRLRPRRAPARGRRGRDDRPRGASCSATTGRRRPTSGCRTAQPPAAGTVVRNPAYAAVLDGLVHARAPCATTDRSGRAARIDAARARVEDRVRRARGVRVPGRSRIGTPTAAPTRASSRPTTSPAFEAGYEPAVTREFRGRTIAKAGAWTQGPALLQTLGLLEPLADDLLDPSQEAGAHTILEAQKLASPTATRWFGDDDVDLDDAAVGRAISTRAARSSAETASPSSGPARCPGAPRSARRCARLRRAPAPASPRSPREPTRVVVGRDPRRHLPPRRRSTAGATSSRRRRRAAGCSPRRRSRRSGSASAPGCR